MNFGTSSASEVFQSTIQQVLSGIKGCKNISDDINIYGRTADEHDTALRQVFEVASKEIYDSNLRSANLIKLSLNFLVMSFQKVGFPLVLQK